MNSRLGPFLVGLGSLLWATDSIVRVPAIAKSDPAFLVFVEHLIGVFALIPILLLKSGSNLFQLGGMKNWLACLLVGAGGSAIALLLFTEAFQYLNPTLNILLQKTQPVAVVLIAYWFLKERPSRNFFKWAGVTIFACIILNVFESESPDLSPSPSPVRGILYSLGASLVWAISTVTGKRLLNEVEPLLATFWRFVFGLLTLCLILLFGSGFSKMDTLFMPEFRMTYLYLGLFPGVIAMWTYYSGMKHTSAATTTIVELIFPVGAILLNYYFLGTTLTPLQIVFALVLLLSVTQVSLLHGDERLPKHH
ncbi:MAG: DMT family transporter [Bdellovibrionales bacterium]|nr:DMT family transporter [Bdellovibrionales bacterium]